MKLSHFFILTCLVMILISYSSCVDQASSEPIEFHPLTNPRDVSADERIVAYLSWWNWNEGVNSTLDLTKVTHVNLSFMNPDSAGKFSITDVSKRSLANLINDAHNNGVRVLMSIGGAGAPDYSSLISSANVSQAVTGIVTYVNEHKLDGVDVDLEGSNITSDYGNFIVALSHALPESALLTAALARWNGNTVPDIALAEFDFINLMAYDATGSWQPNNPGPHSSYQFAVDNITYWNTTRGLAPDKICLGVPFYGYDFSKPASEMYVGYNEILQSNPGAWNDDNVGDIYYNGAATIQQKTVLAKQYGGIMIWEIGMDASGERSLLDVIYSEMQ